MAANLASTKMNPGLAVTLFVGTVMIVFGVARTIAAFSMLPGTPVLKNIQSFNTVQADGLELLIESRKRGLRWIDSGRAWTDLGLAQLLLASAEGVDGERRRSLVGDAIESLNAGLALAPANPFAWTRLAYAESLKNGPSPRVVSALRMALLTAQYEPRLLFVRLELCFQAWAHFGPEDRDLIFKKVRFAWQTQPKRLAELALRIDRVNLVRAALLSSRADLNGFEKLLREQQSSS